MFGRTGIVLGGVVLALANLTAGLFLAGREWSWWLAAAVAAADAAIAAAVWLAVRRAAVARRDGLLPALEMAVRGQFRQAALLLKDEPGHPAAPLIGRLVELAAAGAASEQALAGSAAAELDSQARKVSDSSKHLEALVGSARLAAEHASKANKLAHQAAETASKGRDVVSETVQSMAAISESSNKIKVIMKAIDEIAFQTNLLALNAAVEAARAGDAGVGFAVVAEEVRNLAQRAAEAAENSQALVTETIQRVATGEKSVDETASAFAELVDKAQETAGIIADIQNLTTDQSQQLDHINVALIQASTSLLRLCRAAGGAGEGAGPQAAEPGRARLGGPKRRAGRVLKFRPHWVPQAQFAGFYVALDKGFYREAGLEVEFLDGGPDANPLTELIRGEIDFGTAWLSTALIVHARGADIVELAQIIQKSGLMMVARKEDGIHSVGDLKRRSVGVWPGELRYPVLALDRDRGLNLHLVDQGFDLSEFINREVEVATVMSFNELITLQERGISLGELTLFRFPELGMNFPEDGLYTSGEVLKKDPETCLAFTEASLKGWRFTRQNPAEALQIVMNHHQRSPIQTSRSHQKRMLDEIIQLVDFKGSRLGQLKRQDFERVVSTLLKLGQIERRVAWEEFYRGA